MGELEVSLSKKELKHLFKMAYIGMFVLSESELDNIDKPSDKIIEKLMQIMKAYNVLPGIEYSDSDAQHFLDNETEDNLLVEYNEFITAVQDK